MIDLEFLESLIRAVDESSIDSVEIERGGTRIRVAKTPSGHAVAAPQAGAPVAQPAPPAASGNAGPPAASAPPAPAEETATGEEAEGGDGLVEITSPMVGTFYRAPSPDAPPYVTPGDRISEGDVLCIIEAMKLMNELEAEVSGTIAEVLVDNAEPVEFGQALFKIEPA